MKIYIAGPMRGYPDFNKQSFYNAEKLLKRSGYDVFNPARYDEENGVPLVSLRGDTNDIEGFTEMTMDAIIKNDVEHLLDCDGIYMLTGWENSKGACAEKAVAEWKGLKVMYEAE